MHLRNFVAWPASFALLLGLLFTVCAKAQTPTAEITGSVLDNSGAVIADAAVSLVNPATGAQRTTTTNSAGNYDLPAIPPGNYNLTIEKQGFAAEVRNNIQLQVAQIARFDTILKVGNVSEKVEVTGGAPVLETDSAEIGTVIENRRIVELPLNGRNYLSLTGLTPGVSTTSPVNQVATSREGGIRGTFGISAAGQRAYFNHYTLDGADNTDPNFNAYVLLLSIDALQEFKVQTGTFPPEYGHNLAQVTATTKSGTNEFHGSLFEFLRNSDITAKNYFDSHTKPIPPFHRNQFGGTFSGPIVKNKLFFFFDYEGLRERKGLTKVATVPSQQWRAGNFTGASTIYDPASRVFKYDASGTPISVISATPFQNNMILPNRISPVAKYILANYVPLPNVGGVNNTGVNNYVAAPIQPTNTDQEDIRVDYLQSPSLNWVFRFAHSNENQLVPGTFPGTGEYTKTHVFQGMLGNTWILGPTKVNDFKLSINYMGNTQPTVDSCTKNVDQLAGIPDSIFPSDFCFNWGVPGIFGASDGGGAWADWEGFGTASDNFSWNKGKHDFKFGGEYGQTRMNGINGTYNSGSFTSSGQYSTSGQPGVSIGLAQTDSDALLGIYSTATGTFGPQIFNLRWKYVGVYFEDTWKVTPKLTVNYGLRWEDQPPPTDTNRNNLNVAFAWDNSITPTLIRPGCTGSPTFGNPQYVPNPAVLPFVCSSSNTEFNNDLLNFAPRLGIVYALGSKTVIRLGGGTFFAHEISNGFIEGARNPPFSQVEQNNGNPVQANITYLNPFPKNAPGGTAPASFLSAVEKNEPTSRSYQWTAAVQRQIGANASLEVTYLGTAGAYLERFTTYNTAPPGPGSQVPRYPFPNLLGTIQVLMPSAHSSFETLQARFEQRFSHGFTLLSAFSWGHSIDNASSLRKIGGADTRNPLTPGDIRGNSDFDFRRRWVNSFFYELPFGKGKGVLGSANSVVNFIVGGWTAGGILTLQDGTPISAQCNNFSTFQNGGQQLDGAFCYPNATGIDPNIGGGGPLHYYNLAAFVNQTPYSYGNAGRGTIIGPGIIDMDASIVKNMHITERQMLQFRAECFNVANHPIFGQPGTVVGSPSAGVINGTIIDSREFQFGLKYSF
jgi:hypothetical protein